MDILPVLWHAVLFVGGLVIGAIIAALTTIFQLIVQRLLRVVTVVVGFGTAVYLIYRGGFVLTEQFVTDLGFTSTALISLIQSIRQATKPA